MSLFWIIRMRITSRGFCVLWFRNEASFRISLTGTALEQQATPQVVKKLKLVGTPTKVFKNTAFISGV
jgi:hypothetical protein